MNLHINDIAAPWLALDRALGLGHPIRDEAHYEQLLAFVDETVDALGDQDDHPLWGLIAILADRIRDYEERVHPWPTLPPQRMLALLMEEHGLKQSDLPEVGPQSVVSEILAGKRQLNLRQVTALSARFHVPMEVFAFPAKQSGARLGAIG